MGGVYFFWGHGPKPDPGNATNTLEQLPADADTDTSAHRFALHPVSETAGKSCFLSDAHTATQPKGIFTFKVTETDREREILIGRQARKPLHGHRHRNALAVLVNVCAVLVNVCAVLVDVCAVAGNLNRVGIDILLKRCRTTAAYDGKNCFWINC